MKQGEDARNTLPDELVEKILAMVPFPFVCKARVLSKSWMARFSSISSLDNEEDKRRAISFQEQVGKWSRHWKTFCPATVSSWRNEELDLYGYERASRTWRRLPSLSFLPEHIWRPSFLHRGALQIQGALLLVKAFEKNWLYGDPFELYVANILTRSWKQLPPRPSEQRGRVSNIKLVSHTRETYKVIIVSYRSWVSSLVEIYDSESAAWSKLERSDQFIPKSGPAAYLDGALYIAGHSSRHAVQMLAINIKEETLESMKYDVTVVCGKRVVGDPTICNGNVLMSLHTGLNDRYLETFEAGKPDPQLQELLDMSRGFHLEVGGKRCPKFLTDDDCVFFGVGDDRRLLLAFNVHDEAWNCYPFLINHVWSDLNPFLAV